MKENNYNSTAAIDSFQNSIWYSATHKKVALSLSTILASFIGISFYLAALNESGAVKNETMVKGKNGDVSIESKPSAAGEESKELIVTTSVNKAKLWHVDPHLEKLVDKQIKIWQMSVSGKTGKGPIDSISNWISKVSVYREYIADSADRYAIDENFLTALLAWESRGNPKAKSLKAARGFGQFMKVTASEKGLIVNNVIDERLDPSKSIYAAASYIRDAANRHKRYRFLLTAYYNYGPGNVRKSIKRFGLNKSLFYKLPKETKKHYINIFAIKKLLDNSEEYGFSYRLRPSFKSIVKNSRPYVIKKGEDLSIIAKRNNLDVKMILYKNPKILNPKRVNHGTLIQI